MKIKLQDSVMRFSTLIYCLKPSITLMNKLNQFCGLFYVFVDIAKFEIHHADTQFYP